MRIVIVCARFNEPVTSRLLDGAMASLKACGATAGSLEVVWVPGSFELPLAAQRAAQRSDVDAVVCLGAVIRGQTAHFEYVSEAAALGILEAGLQTGKPVTFGVLTADTVEQAMDRAGGSMGNKGADAAEAAVEMVHVLKQVGGTYRSL